MAWIGVAGSLIVAIVSAVLAARSARKTEQLKADLAKTNADDLERLKTELQEATQQRLQAAKSELDFHNQQRLEAIKAQFTDQGRIKDARLDYLYDAHKRLYRECEPLLFQLAELALNAQHRVYSLARSARRGSIPDWLDVDGYYKRSTMYFLIAPLVVLRLIQRRLTFVDLTLDSHIAGQYRLLRLLYLTFTDDFVFAACARALPYDPNVDDWEPERKKDPARRWRQGIYLGVLDNTIDALVSKDGASCITFGEFEAAHKDTNSTVHKLFLTCSDVLHAFHPRERPVLWRMLVTQTLIYEQILRPSSDASNARVALDGVSPNIPKETLDWRQPNDPETEEEAVREVEQVAREYLEKRLPSVFKAPEQSESGPRDGADAALPGGTEGAV